MTSINVSAGLGNNTVNYETHKESDFTYSRIGINASFLSFYFLCFVVSLLLSQGLLKIIFSLKACLNFLMIGILLYDHLPKSPTQITGENVNPNDAVVEYDFDDIQSLISNFSSLDGEYTSQNGFDWKYIVPDFLQSLEESVTGLFFYEVYQCICSTEIRTADEFLSRAKFVLPLIFLISLVITALQEGAKYLLMDVLEADPSFQFIAEFGVAESVIILLAMIYMTVQIVISLTKAARFRDQSIAATRGNGGFSNFLYFLPFVILASHVIKLSVDIIQVMAKSFLFRSMTKCFSKLAALATIVNGFVTEDDMYKKFAPDKFVDELNCPLGTLFKIKPYSLRFYCSSIECFYVLVNMIRKKIAKKEK